MHRQYRILMISLRAHRNHEYHRQKQLNSTHSKQHNATQRNSSQHNTAQHNTTKHNTTQHKHNTTRTAQHSTTQHNTTQYKSTQLSTTHTSQQQPNKHRHTNPLPFRECYSVIDQHIFQVVFIKWHQDIYFFGRPNRFDFMGFQLYYVLAQLIMRHDLNFSL